jgi:hypothetical protein
MIANSDSAYIRGIAKLGDKLVILLELDKVLDEQEYSTCDTSALTELERRSDIAQKLAKQPAMAA